MVSRHTVNLLKVQPDLTFCRSFVSVKGRRKGRAATAKVYSSATLDKGTKHSERQAREENVAGDFYVDHTCIGEY
jgi:hypothetical protein